MLFDFLKKKKGKNKELNERLLTMRLDMENNYKDAAQLDFKKAKQLYAELLAAGKISDKDKIFYDEQIAGYEKELAHFTHFEGPGSGRYHSGTH